MLTCSILCYDLSILLICLEEERVWPLIPLWSCPLGVNSIISANRTAFLIEICIDTLQSFR